MTTNKTTLVVFASWEERFRLGMLRNIEKQQIDDVIIFYYHEFAEVTKSNRDVVISALNAKNIYCVRQVLGLNTTAENWRTIADTIQGIGIADANFIVDISTMPREIIWYVFWLLEFYEVKRDYCYHRPIGYASSWLSREPGRPRFVYKMGGETDLNLKNALLVSAGYDLQRVKQLISWYEPEKVVIGLQSGSPFNQNRVRMNDYKKQFPSEFGIEFFEYDAYGIDHGEGDFQNRIIEMQDKFNIVASSLGPKITAVALYRLQRQYKSVSLAYAPSREFNADYSNGIGETITGAV